MNGFNGYPMEAAQGVASPHSLGGQANSIAPHKDPSLSDLTNQMRELAEKVMSHAALIVGRIEGSGQTGSPEGKKPMMPMGGQMLEVLGCLNRTGDLLSTIERKLF